ncbi:MAG: hydratase [Clostridiales bacterium]|nr:hydratase [Clostridiales bacterium]
MVELTRQGCYLIGGQIVPQAGAQGVETPDTAREKTIAYRILRAHDKGIDKKAMRITFDALISHDITFVGIIQTARASGLCAFPLPYAMTNCHNSLCAVGGTINEDDHVFGLSAAIKYGGIYVPPNQAVIHQYARECLAGCGSMLLGSDSHTRYGSYGCMGIGEGGGELVKQLLKNTYDLPAPEVVLVYLTGAPRHGVGPHDVALALVAAIFPNGDVKNKVLEFAGPGIANLSADFRIGIDVMTTETSCLTSIWQTDEMIEHYYQSVGRPQAYHRLAPEEGAYYDGVVSIDLGAVESMIALPFHPSKAVTIHALQQNPEALLRQAEESCNQQLGKRVHLDLLRILKNGCVLCDQGIIVGCSGGMYDNIMEAAAILDGKSIGNGYFDLSVYPSSTPISLAITKNGAAERLMLAGAVLKPAFCGPCFGAGDTPANNTFSIRHATRNFANREGSKPSDGQIAAVALMDARSIAATAINGGELTAATDIDYTVPDIPYEYDGGVYERRVYNGYGSPRPQEALRLGPNIKDWPAMPMLGEDLLLRLCAVIHDEVTTTDELIPSGETSSYRSHPIRLSGFALSRRYPQYVDNARRVLAMENERQVGQTPQEAKAALDKLGGSLERATIGSCIFARKPGDGSAREQAASCQKVLGGFANICYEYATKRYRSNCINWGIVPFTIDKGTSFDLADGDYIFIPGLRRAIANGIENIPAKALCSDGRVGDLPLRCAGLTHKERLILQEGCLINYYAAGHAE